MFSISSFTKHGFENVGLSLAIVFSHLPLKGCQSRMRENQPKKLHASSMVCICIRALTKEVELFTLPVVRGLCVFLLVACIDSNEKPQCNRSHNQNAVMKSP